RGGDLYNLVLSDARANSAVDYLVRQGVPPERLIAKGYGESMLVNNCSNGARCSEEDHQANRRTAFKVLSQEAHLPGGREPDYFGAGSPRLTISAKGTCSTGAYTHARKLKYFSTVLSLGSFISWSSRSCKVLNKACLASDVVARASFFMCSINAASTPYARWRLLRNRCVLRTMYSSSS